MCVIGCCSSLCAPSVLLMGASFAFSQRDRLANFFKHNWLKILVFVVLPVAAAYGALYTGYVEVTVNMPVVDYQSIPYVKEVMSLTGYTIAVAKNTAAESNLYDKFASIHIPNENSDGFEWLEAVRCPDEDIAPLECTDASECTAYVRCHDVCYLKKSGPGPNFVPYEPHHVCDTYIKKKPEVVVNDSVPRKVEPDVVAPKKAGGCGCCPHSKP